MSKGSFSGGAPMSIVSLGPKSGKKRVKGRPTSYQAVRQVMVDLGLVCGTCRKSFKMGEFYYVDSHVDCVTRRRRVAQAKKRRQERQQM